MQSQRGRHSHIQTNTFTHTHIHTHTHTWRNSGFNQGPPWEREKGPKPLETLRVVGFPKWGYVCMHTHSHTHTHASSNTQRLVLSLLKIQTDTADICTHMDPHAYTNTHPTHTHTHTHTHTTHTDNTMWVWRLRAAALSLYQEVSYNKPEDEEILLQRGVRRTWRPQKTNDTWNSAIHTHLTWSGSVCKPLSAPWKRKQYVMYYETAEITNKHSAQLITYISLYRAAVWFWHCSMSKWSNLQYL